MGERKAGGCNRDGLWKPWEKTLELECDFLLLVQVVLLKDLNPKSVKIHQICVIRVPLIWWILFFNHNSYIHTEQWLAIHSRPVHRPRRRECRKGNFWAYHFKAALTQSCCKDKSWYSRGRTGTGRAKSAADLFTRLFRVYLLTKRSASYQMEWSAGQEANSGKCKGKAYGNGKKNIKLLLFFCQSLLYSIRQGFVKFCLFSGI